MQRAGGERRELEKGLSSAQERLRQIEARVARASREVAEAEAALARQRAAMQQAQQRRQELNTSLQSQRRQLAQLLRNSHAQGNQTPLRLLLSQDQAEDASRLLTYNRYVQQQRIDMLKQVNDELAELQELESRITAEQEELARRQATARSLSEELAHERRQQSVEVQNLNRTHGEKKNREQALARDVRSLENLLANLRAQAARAQAQRRQAEQREQREQKRQSTAAPTQRRGTTAETARRTAPDTRVGGGSWPVNGQLVTRYGARLPDGRTSTGLLIEAAAGTPVSAVADGTVVFADWMTGYGNILIIDHGAGHMSLYAHNETLLRSQGQRVKRGEPIARVGSSGGQGRNALYFELRRNGQPVDPAGWLRR